MHILSIALPVQWSELFPSPQSLVQNISLTLPWNSPRLLWAPSMETALHESYISGTAGGSLATEAFGVGRSEHHLQGARAI